MDVRYPVHARNFKRMTTAELRNDFLVDDLFKEDEIKLVYSHIDRIVVGSAVPKTKELKIELDKEIGANYFLERREMGIINIGGTGQVIVDGEKYSLESGEGLYLGKGSKEISFTSENGEKAANFYFNSTPAHKKYPDKKIALSDIQAEHLGEAEKCNLRDLYKYIHPEGVQSCQLVMGMTKIKENNNWNTMPCHTHDRRMEVYFYFDIEADNVLFHLFGEPDETRHIVVRNKEAVISPSYSIHSGVGTKNYTFIWGMAGENQTFTDMDHVPMDVLK
ncbi:4-deoxy-L-threo-5-hexulose uronate isomerase [Halanaerobium saccharolyticum]|jgi:4-deoxy-L-threo-5-hexosulose-uronate ketol-isomerase|uniref:4-deoxy-L-threo-5-hexosulose-uronate ketol-isomerase n=1 Tax=Halanaerobium saccharolyticum TaxID=43595 RepID=A0A4R7YY14_9FIRM|nr:5-dehydro-4-deoxy-D-glucuronate isomerase [Halanaerobium saccharolyticum]RAK12704.1 4-deoxy-L-threo-5-hexulose uronate isomerase [Halanaerobium saccharolyticum]TDW02917.1 4-deoxy-L-threo-5-hexulose uronate isomerase [Halanaerobium saccharolyticum]TDX62899.1 4-deoxy-L-threo-5-hexulose uronate isomerase [Halanaerobium saccharolyticum]